MHPALGIDYTLIYTTRAGSKMQTAKLFRNGRSQAVRLPVEFRFEGDEVVIRRDPVSGDVILSAKPGSWDEFFSTRDRLIRQSPDEFGDFMDDRNQGLADEREWP